jgi:hypothetical protein
MHASELRHRPPLHLGKYMYSEVVFHWVARVQSICAHG